MSPRTASDKTDTGQRWLAELEQAQRGVVDAVGRRDELVRQAQADGLSVRAIAQVLGVNKATVSRRYPAVSR